jgi:hypothetical protein
MRKAIGLNLKLWLEGEDEPANDFAQLTMQAVAEAITTGFQQHPNLKVTIKSLVEDCDNEDDGFDEKASDE